MLNFCTSFLFNDKSQVNSVDILTVRHAHVEQGTEGERSRTALLLEHVTSMIYLFGHD
jgi:hypothetical protein